MDQLRIRGGRRLAGEIVISGAKNAALPEMCAALLTAERVELQNVPSLNDVTTMARLLKTLGVGLEMGERGDRTLALRADRVTSHEAPYELVKTMRASILVLGPLLARFGEARVSLPGGCAIGTRPVDQHIKGLQAMGAEIVVEHGYIVAARRAAAGDAHHDRHGHRHRHREPADGGDARRRRDHPRERGAGARGRRPRRDADRDGRAHRGARHEPDPHRRRRPAARRRRTGSSATGSRPARSCARSRRPAATSSLRHARGEHLEAVIDKLREAGATIEVGDGWLRVRADARPRAVSVRTSEYPAFPTDMQAQLMALDCIADGAATITETIFENRFMHVNELLRLGAKVDVDGRVAVVQGVDKLSGATVMATDLRASAGLVIAALVAEGTTVVDRIYHLDRGYDRMEAKLRTLGADIERVAA